jgi:tripartite-type tricarboxylate transporter receptor subunit TctC
VLARVGAALRAATDDPALRARMAEQGVSVQTGDAAMLRGLLARETESWGELIREVGIKPD